MAALGKAGLAGIEQIIGATHAGMTSDEFNEIARDWFETAAHPRFQRPYTAPRLSTDGRGPRPPPGERVQDLHRLRRWHRVHARDLRADVRGPAGPGRREQREDEVRAAGRDAGARSPGGHRLLRRQGGQAGRDPEVHRSAADRGLRQLRRRPADAPVDRGGTGTPSHGPRRSHGCRPRVRLSGLADGDAEARARGGRSARLDGRQHEGRLEGRSSPPSDSRAGSASAELEEGDVDAAVGRGASSNRKQPVAFFAVFQLYW